MTQQSWSLPFKWGLWNTRKVKADMKVSLSTVPARTRHGLVAQSEICFAYEVSQWFCMMMLLMGLYRKRHISPRFLFLIEISSYFIQNSSWLNFVQNDLLKKLGCHLSHQIQTKPFACIGGMHPTWSQLLTGERAIHGEFHGETHETLLQFVSVPSCETTRGLWWSLIHWRCGGFRGFQGMD